LNKECGKKIKKEDILKGKEITDSACELSLNQCKKHSENQNPKKEKEKKDKEVLKKNEIKEDGVIICIGSFASERLSVVFNNDIFIEKKISCPVFDRVYVDEPINKKCLEKHHNKMSEFYSNDSTNNKAMTFFGHGKMVIMGGFFDGKVIFSPLDGKGPSKVEIPFKDESPVLSITCDKDEDFIFMGNTTGNVCVYKNIDDEYKNVYLLSDHNSAISHIFCSDELNMLATASIDGYICLYTLPLCKLVRNLKIPTGNISYVFLSDSPLPSIIVISDENNNSQIYVYSINGKFYTKKEEYFQILNPILTKDLDSNDYLVCIGNDNIYIIGIPDLIVKVQIEKIFNIHSICFSEDNKTLYAINKKGTEVTVIKEEKQRPFRSASFMRKKE
jgi:WD40 repeat protein